MRDLVNPAQHSGRGLDGKLDSERAATGLTVGHLPHLRFLGNTDWAGAGDGLNPERERKPRNRVLGERMVNWVLERGTYRLFPLIGIRPFGNFPIQFSNPLWVTPNRLRIGEDFLRGKPEPFHLALAV